MKFQFCCNWNFTFSLSKSSNIKRIIHQTEKKCYEKIKNFAIIILDIDILECPLGQPFGLTLENLCRFVTFSWLQDSYYLHSDWESNFWGLRTLLAYIFLLPLILRKGLSNGVPRLCLLNSRKNSVYLFLKEPKN